MITFSKSFYRDDMVKILVFLLAVLNLFNSAHAILSVSQDENTEGRFNFLDIKHIRQPNETIQRSTYGKATWSD